MRVIATSATLADDAGGVVGIARFASDLFGEPVEPEQVILSETDSVLERVHSAELVPAPPSAEAYLTLPSPEQLKDQPKEWIIDRLSVLGGGTDTTWSNPQQYVAQMLIRNPDVHRLWKAISEQPRALRQLAQELFPEDSAQSAEEALVRLVELGNYGRLDSAGPSVLSARYHFFVSGLAGVFADLTKTKDGAPWGRLALTTRDLDMEDGAVAPVEIATCSSCGGHYVVGHVVQHTDGRRYLQPVPQSMFEAPDAQAVTPSCFFTFDRFGSTQDECSFCPRCGVLSGPCDCQVSSRTLYAVDPRAEDACVYCGVSDFEKHITSIRSPQHGPAAVLAEELYRQLPGLTPTEMEDLRQKNEGRFLARNASPITGEARKLLIFSDNRQQAAFFSGFLQRTHLDQLHRGFIFRVLTGANHIVTLPETVDRLLATLTDHEFRGQVHIPFLRDLRPDERFHDEFHPISSSTARRGRVYEILYRELVRDLGNQGLEGQGLVQVSVDFGPSVAAPRLPGLLVSDDEWFGLIQLILSLLRREGALSVPPDMSGIDYGEFVFGSKPIAYFVKQNPRLRTIESRPFIPRQRSRPGRL